MMKEILILGAGYGGLTTALTLQRNLSYNEAKITLVNKHDYHYITTHLHQPAAGTVNPSKIKINLNELINMEKINFVKAEVKELPIHEKKVILHNGDILTYDILVVSLGSDVETFGIEGLKEYAFSIRSINSVQMIRHHIEKIFADYKATNEQKLDEGELTFIVGGAGFTGIEFVGELADRIPQLIKTYDIDPNNVRIINIEAAPNALPGFDPKLVDYAVETLKNKGVEFKINTPIKACTKNSVILANGEEIKSKTIVWTGGVRGSEIIETMGIETIRSRVKVDSFLRAPGFQDVFVIGDNSIVFNEEGKPYPPTAQIATQQGEHVGKQIMSFVRNEEMELTPFVFHFKGTVASLGKGEAIGRIGNWKLAGYTAAVMKNIIDNRYLYSIGGLPLVLKKGKILG